MKDNRAVPSESMEWIYLWTGPKDEGENQLNIENLRRQAASVRLNIGKAQILLQ